jgi:hypothetical protein
MLNFDAMFSTEIFMARGHSYLWTPWLLIAEVATNAALALGLLIIAVRLFRRGRAPEPGPPGLTGLWLGLLALALLTVHLSDVWTIWTPAYGVDAAIRGAAALIALAAAILI